MNEKVKVCTRLTKKLNAELTALLKTTGVKKEFFFEAAIKNEIERRKSNSNLAV
jgi:hypothetical protein